MAGPPGSARRHPSFSAIRRHPLNSESTICSGALPSRRKRSCALATSPPRPKAAQSGGIARLGIKPISFRDGPLGLRTFDGTHATAMPCTLALACTWDLSAPAHDYGRLLAEEFQAVAGAQVLFGPGLDLMRDPRGGRNFEYLGEDPFPRGQHGGQLHSRSPGIGNSRLRQAPGGRMTTRPIAISRVPTSTSAPLGKCIFCPSEMAIREGGCGP